MGWSICFKYSLSSNIFLSPPPGLCFTLSSEPIFGAALISIFWFTIWNWFWETKKRLLGFELKTISCKHFKKHSLGKKHYYFYRKKCTLRTDFAKKHFRIGLWCDGKDLQKTNMETMKDPQFFWSFYKILTPPDFTFRSIGSSLNYIKIFMYGNVILKWNEESLG